MIGILISVACMLVLSVIMMTSLNKAMSGAGNALSGTASSFQDKQYLSILQQGLVTWSMDNDGQFIVPSTLDRSRDLTHDTTANLYSAMIAEHYTVPGQLVSGNEYNPNVWMDEDYDYMAYRPIEGTFWDPGFVADLDYDSNTSFAHVPLFARRRDNHWRFSASSTVPVLGNRGPRDGIDNPNSLTYGRDGGWGGHLVFGDGHVEFIKSFTLAGRGLTADGTPDNVFAMEEGPNGRDAILSFTKLMTDDGPTLQYD